MLTAERKQQLILENARHEGDTGSPEVQIAVLSERHQIFDRASERTQKRSSFPSRPAENGWSTSWSAELSDG